MENDEHKVRLEVLESTAIQFDKDMKQEILGITDKIEGIDIMVKGNYGEMRAINSTLDGLKIAPVGKLLFHMIILIKIENQVKLTPIGMDKKASLYYDHLESVSFSRGRTSYKSLGVQDHFWGCKTPQKHEFSGFIAFLCDNF